MIKHLHYANGNVFYDKEPLYIEGLRFCRYLGEGANGLVVDAEDLKLDRHVAVKFWDRARPSDDQSRALREMRKLASVEHEYIVRVYQVGEVNSVPYAVMELVRGVTAKDWLAERELTIDERYQFWRKYLEALMAIYATGNVHGDPHTGNILVRHREDGSFVGIKVTDLGASIVSRPGLRRAREPVIIAETAERIWAPVSPTDFIGFPERENLRLVVRALESFGYFLWTLDQARNVTDEDVALPHAFQLAKCLLTVPVFDLRRAVAVVKETNLPRSALYQFLNHVQEEGLLYARYNGTPPLMRPGTISSFPIEISEVEMAYRKWREVYIEQRLYGIDTAPIFGLRWPQSGEDD